jgi:hypothetical protein
LFAAAAYAAAIIYLAWPLPSMLGDALVDSRAIGQGIWGVWGRADEHLQVWILAWDATALTTHASRLFDGNIFYPAPSSLASSEHLLGLAPIATPTFLVTNDAIATYNVTVLLVTLVSALSTFQLARAWTSNAPAAFLAGVAYALAPLSFRAWTRLHTATHLFPLVLLLLWRSAAEPRRRTLAWLAFVTSLQVLTSWYAAYQLLILLAVFAPAVWWEARRHGRRALAPAAAVLIGMLVLIPMAIPYLRARAIGVLPEGAANVVEGSASPFSLAEALVGNLTWPLLALAGVGLLSARAAPAHLRAGLLGIAVAGGLLSLGPAVPLVPGTSLPGPYGLATLLIPGFSAMRKPARFAVLPLLALVLLAALGTSALARHAGQRGRRIVAVLAVLGGITLLLARTGVPLEAAPARMEGRAPGIPLPVLRTSVRAPEMAVYRWLREFGGGRPVLELPAMGSVLQSARVAATERYMLGATIHWLPLVNGYSGYPPPSDGLLMTLAERLPDPTAFADLCDLVDLGWLVVHADSLPNGADAWRETEPSLGITQAIRLGASIVYRVDRPCGALRARLLHELRDGASHVTLRGVPRAPLPAGAYRGRLVGKLPHRLPQNGTGWAWITVTNRSPLPWPGLSARSTGRVALQARWRDAATGMVMLENDPTPLANDLWPGESRHVQVQWFAPPPGRYVLEVGLFQQGMARFGEQPGGARELRRLVRTFS